MSHQQDAREQARHKASVMIAFAEGKQIQFQLIVSGQWIDCEDAPRWLFDRYLYRVKPEERKPREVEIWVNDDMPSDMRYPGIFRPTEAGWRLATFREVLPSENTGGEE